KPGPAAIVRSAWLRKSVRTRRVSIIRRLNRFCPHAIVFCRRCPMRTPSILGEHDGFVIRRGARAAEHRRRGIVLSQCRAAWPNERCPVTDTMRTSAVHPIRHPVHALLRPVPIVCFTGALLTDIAYMKTPD